MGATNHTTYYELSQFIGTDKPAWLQDYNGDMTKIDAGIKEAKNAADDADTAASNAQGDATDALNAIETINTTLGTIEDTLGTATGNISTINSLIGNGTPTTSDQTIIGAINGIEGAIAPREDGENLANSYAIGEQFARGGSIYTALAALTANTPFASLVLNTDYKVSDSIVEQLTNYIPYGDNTMKSLGLTAIHVTADGVKTVSTLLNELYTAVHDYISGRGEGYAFTPIDVYGIGIRGIAIYAGKINTSFGSNKYCENVIHASDITFNEITLASGASGAKKCVIANDGTVTITDLGSDVLADGTEIETRFESFILS